MFQNISKIKFQRLSTLLLILITATVLILSCTYILDLKSVMYDEAENYLDEISDHIYQLVDYNFKEIEKDGSIIQKQLEESYNLNDINSYLPYLKKYAEERGFLRICIADNNGTYHATDHFGTHQNDQKIYDKIMKGESHFLNYEELNPTNGEYDSTIIYGMPLIQANEVKAAMFISNDNSHLSSTLDVPSFDNSGYSIIIDQNGDYVFHSDNKNSVPEVDNFFEMEVSEQDDFIDLQEMATDIKNKEEGYFEFTPAYNEVEKAVNYRPIGNEGWYLLSIIPTNAMRNNMDIFLRYSLVIVGALVCLFMVVIFMLYYHQKKSKEELERIAFVDPVTNGINHNRFTLDALPLIKAKPEKTYCMISMDIKDFKVVNTTTGTRSGNELLAYTYYKLTGILKEGELAARVNGDIFHAILKFTSQQEIIDRLQAFAKELNEFNETIQSKYYIYIQTGVYIIDIPDLSMIKIQDRANVARKSAKKQDSQNLNTIVYYRDVERQRLLREKEIENRMEGSLANGEFAVYLQPKYCLKKDQINGAEALIRWIDPIHGVLLPGEFLPFFEKNRFILKIDLFVFKQVCDTLQKWFDEGKALLQISVNLSKLHLNDPDFLNNYMDIFKKYTFPAEYLRFEVTETLIFDNLELLKEVLRKIHEFGFTISLDDFGSGYSSLNLLKDIVVDEIKLDYEFFTNKEIDSRSMSVIESILTLAKKLNMVTVSEGVQTNEQMKFLKDNHCDMVQTFLMYKPMPISDFEAIVFKEDNVKS